MMYFFHTYTQKNTFGVNVHSQYFCLVWDTKLFRCSLETVRNFRSAPSFNHLSGTE